VSYRDLPSLTNDHAKRHTKRAHTKPCDTWSRGAVVFQLPMGSEYRRETACAGGLRCQSLVSDSSNFSCGFSGPRWEYPASRTSSQATEKASGGSAYWGGRTEHELRPNLPVPRSGSDCARGDYYFMHFERHTGYPARVSYLHAAVARMKVTNHTGVRGFDLPTVYPFWQDRRR
jgi:hypothetical protein